MQNKLFEGKTIRSAWDETNKKRWFSVVDVCAVLTGSDYQRARNYWKWLKRKLLYGDGQTVSTTNQLKMEAGDGKLRFTDVMDAAGLLLLIQLCPSPKAWAVKRWLAELAAEGVNLVKCLTEAFAEIKDMVRSGVAPLFMTTRVRVYDLGVLY